MELWPARHESRCTSGQLGDLSPRSKQDWLALAHKLESALSGQDELIRSSADPELDRLVARVKSSASSPVQDCLAPP